MSISILWVSSDATAEFEQDEMRRNDSFHITCALSHQDQCTALAEAHDWEQNDRNRVRIWFSGMFAYCGAVRWRWPGGQPAARRVPRPAPAQPGRWDQALVPAGELPPDWTSRRR